MTDNCGCVYNHFYQPARLLMGKGKSAGKRFADKQIRKAQQAQAAEAARQKEAKRREARARAALKEAQKPKPPVQPTPPVEKPPVQPTPPAVPYVICHFRVENWEVECGCRSDNSKEYCVRCGSNLPGKFSTYRRHWFSQCGHRNGPEMDTCNVRTCREPAPWNRAPNMAPASRG